MVSVVFSYFCVFFNVFRLFLSFRYPPPSPKSCKTTEKKQVTALVHARGRSPKISEFFMKNTKILVLNFRLFLAFLHEKSLGSEMHCVGELLQKSSIALSKSTPPPTKKSNKIAKIYLYLFSSILWKISISRSGCLE